MTALGAVSAPARTGVGDYKFNPVQVFYKFRTHPAWVVSRQHGNPFNLRTAEILAEFQRAGFSASDGNIIIPQGNARQYLSDYYDTQQDYTDPYADDPDAF